MPRTKPHYYIVVEQKDGTECLFLDGSRNAKRYHSESEVVDQAVAWAKDNLYVKYYVVKALGVATTPVVVFNSFED